MFIDKDSLQVKLNNMQDYISLGQYIVEAKYDYNKLWSNGGRSLAGKMTSTFVGVFPKIIIQFRKLTQEEVELLAPILDSPKQTLQYYDPFKKANVTMNTYTGDWGLTNTSIIDLNHKNNGFQISFIAIERRA